MLEISVIKKNIKNIKKSLSKRGFSQLSLLDKIVQEDEQRKNIQQKLEENQQKANLIAYQIGELYKKKKIEEANHKKKETVKLKVDLKRLENKLKKVKKSLRDMLLIIPNTPNKLVPTGASEKDNVVLKKNGLIPEMENEAQPHWDLATRYNLINFELGNKITGSGFPVYVNKGAKLQRALISYFLDKNIAAGYIEYLPPHLVNEDSGIGTGQLPKFEEDLYKISLEKNLYLIPTAEVPVTNFFRNVILNKKDIPIKCTAYTPCFRREAGSYGKNVRGLNRLHQFDKVEIVQIQTPEKSYNALDEMVKHVESLLIELALPYRIVRLCGADLGFSSSLTYDFEVYSAAQKKWLEVSSVSNFESYQSNRLKLRFRSDNQAIKLCHTLNGSALALPRILAALLENNQNSRGIKIPEVLHAYTGFKYIK